MAKIKYILSAISICLLFYGCTAADPESALETDVNQTIDISGQWTVENDIIGTVVLNVCNTELTFLNYPDEGSDLTRPVLTEFDEEINRLDLHIHSEEYRSIIRLDFKDDNKPTAFFISKSGQPTKLTCTKTSDTPSVPQFTEAIPFDRLEALQKYAAYDDSDYAVEIDYHYDLNEKERYMNIIEKYGDIPAEKEDVDLMFALLDLVCDNFKHDGYSGLPSESGRTIEDIIEFAENNDNSVNCRGLSLILAELLRAYGIPAKHISCLPAENDSHDSHVVVHAYSEKLNQWIMLDPSYRLVLHDTQGTYINLETLRSFLIAEDHSNLLPNDTAAYNGTSMDMESYLEYMTKNTFRFMNSENYYYASDFAGNTVYTLVPLNYEMGSGGISVHNPAVFWKLPE